MKRTVNDYFFFQSSLAGFMPCDQDVDSSDADTNYYGYENAEGEWYIMKEDLSVGGDADLISWRYSKGDDDYATNWAGREALSYTRTSIAFK